MKISFANYFLIMFIAFLAMYSTNAFGFAEIMGTGAVALFKAISISVMWSLFMVYTDKPMLNAIGKLVGSKNQ